MTNFFFVMIFALLALTSLGQGMKFQEGNLRNIKQLEEDGSLPRALGATKADACYKFPCPKMFRS